MKTCIISATQATDPRKPSSKETEMVIMEESMEQIGNLQDPDEVEDDGNMDPPYSDGGTQCPTNGGTRGTAPASTSAAQQHPSASD
jgi:hypothetical protein